MKEKEPMCEPDEEELSDGWHYCDDKYFKEEEEKQERYWEAVWKSDGFDLEDLKVKKPHETPLFSFDSPREEHYNKSIISYAKLGIHRYNMFEDKNLQFSSMVKYNYICTCLVRTSNFITCLAKDPDCSGSPQPFQSGVIEQGNDNDTVVCCFIARPKSAAAYVLSSPTRTSTSPVPYVSSYDPLPRWPSSEDAFMDQTQYYLLKRSEVRKYDFIRLYLEVAFTKANTYLESRPDLANLIITKVAVQMGQGQVLSQKLETGNATFFIKYKYYPKNCRSPRNRIAIVRRVVDKERGTLSLIFNSCLVTTFL